MTLVIISITLRPRDPCPLSRGWPNFVEKQKVRPPEDLETHTEEPADDEHSARRDDGSNEGDDGEPEGNSEQIISGSKYSQRKNIKCKFSIKGPDTFCEV